MRKMVSIGLLAALLVTGCDSVDSDKASARVEVHAHRGGAAIRPENSIEAFTVAIRDIGVDAVELDVRPTSDHALVIHHNPSINPAICLNSDGQTVNSQATISSMTFEQVRAFDCGTLVGLPKGTKLPTLDEVFEKTAELRTPSGAAPDYDLHVKSDYTGDNNPTAYTSSILQTIQAHGLLARVHIMMENPTYLSAARSQEPDAVLYYLTSYVTSAALMNAQIFGVNAVVPQGQYLTAAQASSIHQLGAKVIPYTVNSPFGWVAMSQLGADGIITDDPVGLEELIGGNPNPLDNAEDMALED
jgi:glycerophosphoryl diester phosphodiesterase